MAQEANTIASGRGHCTLTGEETANGVAGVAGTLHYRHYDDFKVECILGRIRPGRSAR